MVEPAGFEWDEDKSEARYQRRGFEFEYAAPIFDRDTLEMVDDRFDFGEAGIIAIRPGRTASYRA